MILVIYVDNIVNVWNKGWREVAFRMHCTYTQFVLYTPSIDGVHTIVAGIEIIDHT